MLDGQLNDPSQFSIVPGDVAIGLIDRLQAKLASLAHSWNRDMPWDVYQFLLDKAENGAFDFPKPYAMPKVHKMDTPTREHLHQLSARVIVPSHSWVTTPASIYLADVLNNACGAQYPYVLPDSKTHIRNLEGQYVPRDSILVSFDIESMYPNIDNAAAILACCLTVKQTQRGMLQEMCEFVMYNSYISRNGVIRKQINGAAMGTPCAPPFANIYIARDLEDSIKASHPHLWPDIYHRLIDDGFFVWCGSEHDLDTFVHLLGNTLPNIKIKVQRNKNRLAFLDLWIVKDMSVDGDLVPICFETYQKPHNKYLYIPYFSHHRPHIFKAWVKAELLRYAVNSTHEEDFLIMKELFLQRLLDRGYPSSLLQPIFDIARHSDRTHSLHNTHDAQDNTYIQHNTTSHAPPRGPVFTTQYGKAEKSMNLGVIINGVYEKYKHDPTLHDIFGDRIIIAYKNSASLGKLLVKADA